MLAINVTNMSPKSSVSGWVQVLSYDATLIVIVCKSCRRMQFLSQLGASLVVGCNSYSGDMYGSLPLIRQLAYHMYALSNTFQQQVQSWRYALFRNIAPWL